MSECSNIDFFNRLCVILFDRLYAEFPKKSDISVDELLDAALKQHDTTDSRYLLELVSDAVSFLVDEDFITIGQHQLMSGKEIGQARLTMKGLSILGCPVSLEPKAPTLIDSIKTIVESGAKDAGGMATSKLITTIFGMATGIPSALLSLS